MPFRNRILVCRNAFTLTNCAEVTAAAKVGNQFWNTTAPWYEELRVFLSWRNVRKVNDDGYATEDMIASKHGKWKRWYLKEEVMYVVNTEEKAEKRDLLKITGSIFHFALYIIWSLISFLRHMIF